MGSTRARPAIAIHPPAPAREVGDILRQLAHSVTTSERKFEELCRDYARRERLDAYGFSRQSIRDASLFGLSAHKLGTLHEICGVRFGSLVLELCGIQLNDLARWQAEAYPDQTIRLPDYLWNPEVLLECPISLDPAILPTRSEALSKIVTDWASLPLGILQNNKFLRVFRIGDSGMHPLYHAGDLVVVDTSPECHDLEKIESRQPVMVRTDGQYRLCWIEPSREGKLIYLAFASDRYSPIETDPERIRLIGKAYAFFKDLRARPAAGDSTSRPRLRRREAGFESQSKVGALIHRKRMGLGVSIRELVERLERIEPLLPPQLAGKIPSVSSLSAMEHQGISRARIPQLILLSVALQTDLRLILADLGINVQDQGKLGLPERIGRRRPVAESPLRLAGHPLAEALNARWRGVPWLMSYLLPQAEADSIFYIGKRSRFMHPMMTDHCFAIANLKRNVIPEARPLVNDDPPVEGWPRMYMLRMRGAGQITCAHCRRHGDTLHMIALDQFGGERLAWDLTKDVSVLGEVTGVLSYFP